MKRLMVILAAALLSASCVAICGAFVLAQRRAEVAVERWEAALKLGHPGAAENLLRAHAALAAARLAVKACEKRVEGTEILDDGSVVSLVSLSPLTYTRNMPGAIGPPELIDFGEELAALGIEKRFTNRDKGD